MPSAERRVRVRSYDPARSRAALAAQTQAVRALVHRLCARADAGTVSAAPARFGGRTVAGLIADLGGSLDAVTDNLGLPAGEGAPLTPTDWVAATRGAAAPAATPAGTVADAAAALDAAAERALGLLAEEYAPQLRLPTRFGPMLLTDFLVTRLVRAVLLADDLAQALAEACPELCPDPDGFPHDRQALAAATRLLADALAVQAPGGAVELRVPPFAVVQCVAGPRHTRGTPPNVVETSPLPWIRLAGGRLSWAEATGAGGNVAQLTASGERSDLSALLPVMG